MFKTIEQCRLDLVAYSVGVPYEQDGLMVDMTDLDMFACSAARVSFGNEDKTGKDPKADRKLMKYLADHQHMTPFEHQSATFLVEVPLFVRSQIHRHRTFAYNEISRRYTEENLEFWIPTTWREQATNNRQASAGEITDGAEHLMSKDYKLQVNNTAGIYEELLANGLSREQARAVLPQSLLTKFYMTGNLRNWVHFCKLRMDSHAQYEVQVPARRISEELSKLWPTAWGVLMGDTNEKEQATAKA